MAVVLGMSQTPIVAMAQEEAGPPPDTTGTVPKDSYANMTSGEFTPARWRLNLHVIHVEKSPAGSSFGYYVPGQTGTTISLGTDILL